MATSILNASLLIDVLDRFLNQPGCYDKLKWWLLFGPSVERWFQFEYGFRLNEQLGSDYVVGYERSVVDLVVHHRKSDRFPVWDNEVVANIELKVAGNWHTDKRTFQDIIVDQRKVEKCDQLPSPLPGVVLVFWFFATPNPSAKCYGWIASQVATRVKRRLAFPTPESIEERMTMECNGAFEKIGTMPIHTCDDAFDSLEVQLFWCRNETAKKLIGGLLPKAEPSTP